MGYDKYYSLLYYYLPDIITNSLQDPICTLLVACMYFFPCLNTLPYLVGGVIIYTSCPNLELTLGLLYGYYHVEAHVYHLFWVHKSYLLVRM